MFEQSLSSVEQNHITEVYRYTGDVTLAAIEGVGVTMNGVDLTNVVQTLHGKEDQYQQIRQDEQVISFPIFRVFKNLKYFCPGDIP